jgi:hypothetical protein
VWRDYLHAVALAAGHTPDEISGMGLRDLELLAIGVLIHRHTMLNGLWGDG